MRNTDDMMAREKNMLFECCWSLKRDSKDVVYKRQYVQNHFLYSKSIVLLKKIIISL